MELEGLIGKRVYVLLKSERKYTGLVICVENSLLVIRDKFNKRVFISPDEISYLEEED